MSSFDLTWKPYDLQLKEVFTISRSSRTSVPVVFVGLSKDGIVGYGEASPNSRYKEDTDRVIQDLNSIPEGFFDTLSSPEEVSKRVSALEIKQCTKMALEMAWLDWWAKSKEQPLWKLWDYKSATGPVTSYTIGIDTPEIMQKKIRDAADYPVYKIKLGTDHDRELIRAIRKVTDKPIRVDANEGWKDLDHAKREISFLADQKVELIEQPMPSSSISDMKKLKEWSPLPLAADESFLGSEELTDISEAFHIINIKLMKIGSLVRARAVLNTAHDLGLQVMIGCMIESSLANAAGALLALNADFADLDGHLLISNDPFKGLHLNSQQQVVLSAEAGLGVTTSNFTMD